MKKLIICALVLAFLCASAAKGYCAVKYINGYTRNNGTYVSGHYRDTSNDGYSYNNANNLGYNSY